MLKYKFPFLFIVFLSNAAMAGAVYDGKPLPEDETERCRIAVTEMIKLFESNMAQVKREERKQQYQSLLDEWKQRQKSNEAPCTLYQDIFNTAFAL